MQPLSSLTDTVFRTIMTEFWQNSLTNYIKLFTISMVANTNQKYKRSKSKKKKTAYTAVHKVVKYNISDSM